jgi:hypothetical protein
VLLVLGAINVSVFAMVALEGFKARRLVSERRCGRDGLEESRGA